MTKRNKYDVDVFVRFDKKIRNDLSGEEAPINTKSEKYDIRKDNRKIMEIMIDKDNSSVENTARDSAKK